ncbi:hypothetical protein EIKCOROL_02052 [Eikenella corrodens ATCC 23834]|uniref:Uncharacterized protein n=1 Tax=Eikenella corrodens ATCC 23834 TaxID=546274 RepID=C0DXE5_EIKCO|nr:hypothetical protein EIKCOROL_02052 [Eikenella corrodens ATCC 23834]
MVGQHGLRAYPIFYGHHREIGTVGLAGGWIGAQRAAAAGAAAQIVEPDHEKAVGIHRFIGADHVVPPTGVFVVRMMAAGHVVRAGQGVANQDGVGLIGIECAVGFSNQIKTGQRVAVLQGKGLFECNGLRGNDAHRSGWVHKWKLA